MLLTYIGKSLVNPSKPVINYNPVKAVIIADNVLETYSSLIFSEIKYTLDK